MLTYDPVASLRHWPSPMRRFGLTPFGDALYRIVFASSRRHLVCGTWPDGSNKAQYVRRYPHLGEQWIMERWLPAEEYAKCSKEQWNRDLLILGPWPERGEYDLCHTFELAGPDDANLEKLIAWIDMGRKTSFYDTHVYQREDAAREKRTISDTQDAMIRNWLPAFGSAPMSGPGGGRGSKTAPILKTANELNLPLNGGQIQARKNLRAPKFELPLSLYEITHAVCRCPCSTRSRKKRRGLHQGHEQQSVHPSDAR